MPAIESSIPALLGQRARQQPDKPAYTYIDYAADPAGRSESLTWSEVHQRAQVVAAELACCGSPGDRVAILAPQGFDYIVGFLGVLQAGFIAVPLAEPQLGAERVSAALRDCSPTALLTTSAAVDDVDSCAHALPGSPPAVLEINDLDFYSPPTFDATDNPNTETALLQYTSGSTRQPTGVVVTHHNIFANVEQVVSDHFEDSGGVPPPDMTLLSWLPFYHDMGLLLGVVGPVLTGSAAVLTSPVAFLQKPARWMQLLAGNSRPFSAGPNFAFELAVRRTSDDDMAGLDLGNVLSITTGSERVHAATIRRFSERFARFNLPESALRPSYGLAEAMVYVVSSAGRPPTAARFDYEKLSAGHAKRCDEGGVELVSHGPPRACTMRIVDPETCIENPAGKVGEIWVHGDNVAGGYWRNPQASARTFGKRLVDPSPGTPPEPWLRTGDLGVMSDGEVFIIGRIKDVLVVDGRNHYPDDIEATISEITGGRVAAISVPDGRSEQLVTIVEFKNKGSSDREVSDRLHTIKRGVTSAILKSHGLRVADLVLVPPGSIPITTSGKIRRFACVDQYRRDEFTRVDVPA
jgi:long chain fatty acid CoA FadD26